VKRETSFPAFVPTSANLVRESARRFGDKTLVVLDTERLTYADLESKSAEIAKGLLAIGVTKGAKVGLLAPNGPDWVIGLFAITRIGAVAVLLNTYNKVPELNRTLRHSDQFALLTVGTHLSNDYLDRIEQAAPGIVGQKNEHLMIGSHPFLRSVWTWGAEPRSWCGSMSDLVQRGAHISDEFLAEVESEVHPADPMVFVYSSGSTSDPKAAVHSHGATVRHAHNLWQMRDLQDDDVLYTPMPLFWVGGFSYTLIACMYAGAAVVFEEQFEPGATLELIERERVTQVLGWPHIGKALVDHPDFKTRDLSRIRAGNFTALLPPDLQAEAEIPKATSLGMTETLGPHTFDSRQPLPPDKIGSFGYSVPGVEHKIVDPVTGEEMPTGSVGEVWLRGYSLMLGFHKRERADTFTPDGWYRTGDAGRFDADGHFYFTGRMGDLIKTSGMNVTPREVEEVLEAMPEVVLAFVAGIEHAVRGQDVVALVALRPGHSLDEATARARVKEQIANYKVPRHIAVFSDQNQLPWLDSGKLDRRRVTAMLAERFGES
jgi:acyl-CoA synthetase (AMP-forming)/AMP-acid ligase II